MTDEGSVPADDSRSSDDASRVRHPRGDRTRTRPARESGTNRIGRRRLLGLLGTAGVVGTAGCLGDDGGQPDGDSGDDQGDDDQSDDQNADDDQGDDQGNGVQGDDGDEAAGDGDDSGSAGDDAAQEGADESWDLRPSDVDFEPADGFADDHPDVEVPDEPGRAVLDLDGERIEFDELQRASGGPMSESRYEGVVEDDEFSNAVAYFSLQILVGSTSHDTTVAVHQHFYGGFGVRPGYVRRDKFEIIRPDEYVLVQHLEYEDGSIGTRDVDGETHLAEPIVRIDRDGIATAVGEIRDATGSSLPEGPFEFSANVGADWY